MITNLERLYCLILHEVHEVPYQIILDQSFRANRIIFPWQDKGITDLREQ